MKDGDDIWELNRFTLCPKTMDIYTSKVKVAGGKVKLWIVKVLHILAWITDMISYICHYNGRMTQVWKGSYYYD